jgi:osmotically-inducible protein OsmY
VKVERGWVTLDGTVHWQFQKAAAERALRGLTGVKGISNFVVVRPQVVSPTDLSQRIRDALRRNAEFDASRIAVDVAQGKVTLSGVVRSVAEREDAERAVWAAPGVTDVEDRLTVGA